MTQATEGVRYLISAEDQSSAVWRTALANARSSATSIEGVFAAAARKSAAEWDALTNTFKRSAEAASSAWAGLMNSAGGSARATDAAWKSAVQTARSSAAEMVASTTKAASAMDALMNKQRARVAAPVNARALQMVGPQITDIATGLATGQTPFTVLLQQGGQLKDMFGGIGPAARAVGGYVAGLVNPFTIAAGTVAVFGAAMYKGAQESETLGRALITTNDAIGKSVGQLSDLSAAVAQATGNTRGAVTDAIAQIVSTGQIGAEALESVTTAAVNLDRIGGQAVQDTVKDFVALGQDPVNASERLNKAHHYLTAAIFDQIKALQDQGKSSEAAALAQKAYADAVNREMARVKENMGALERSWLAVKDAAKSAWDSMLGIGRKASISEQIAAQEALIERIRSGDEVGNIDVAQKYLATLKASADLGAKDAKSAETKAKAAEAHAAWVKEGDKYLSRQQQREQEIARARQMGKDAGASEKDINDRIKAIQEKYKDPAGRKGPKPDLNVGQDLDAARAYAAAIKSLNDIEDAAKGKTEELTTAQAALARIMDSPEWARMPESWREVIRVQAEATMSAEREMRTQQMLRESYDRTIQPLRDRVAELERENDLYGLTEAQINTVIAARIDEAVAIARANGANEDQIATLERERDLRMEIAKQAGDKDLKDMDRKRIQDEADQWKRATDDIAQAFTDAIFRGGQSGWKLFMNVVKASVIRATILPQVQQEIGGYIGAGKGLFGEAAGVLKGLMGGGNSAASAAKTAEDYIDAGGLGGGGGGMGDMFGKLLSSLPSFDVGIDRVPYDMVAKIHKDERIVRAVDNRPGFGGITQHFTFQLAGAIDQRTTTQIGAQVGAQTRRAMRRNG